MTSETDPQPRERAEVSLPERSPEHDEFAACVNGDVLLVAEKPCG